MLRALPRRQEELQRQLTEATSGENPQVSFADLSKRVARLGPSVEAVQALDARRKELKDLEVLLQTGEPELQEMARTEYAAVIEQLRELELQLANSLVPRDHDDARNAVLEVRAGTGGEEAALFAADMFSMYRKYASLKGWRFEVLHTATADQGGYRDASALISGRNVFGALKYEAGTHRVQRVPITEATGRVHTSTMTVALMPEVEDIDVRLDERDLRIETYRSGGPGGQHANKTESAVRITHIPTGIQVRMQDERSQVQNKSRALKILRARLYEDARTKALDERSALRKSQIGRGERHERIRTYNFSQQRVTDHRVNVSYFDVQQFLDGKLLDALRVEFTKYERQQLLEGLTEEYLHRWIEES
jgi:peptide chain release factor 1